MGINRRHSLQGRWPCHCRDHRDQQRSLLRHWLLCCSVPALEGQNWRFLSCRIRCSQRILLANACIEDFAAVGTATAFKGTTKLSTLQASPDMSSNPSTTTNACGRANAACAAPPSTWNGGQAIFTKCSKTTDVLGAPTRDCTDAELKGQIGMLPSA